MSATKHRLVATIPCGDPDLGGETECEITFTFAKGSPDYYNASAGHWEQGWGAEIEFVAAKHLVNGKPAPFTMLPDLEQAWLNDLSEAWLALDDGRMAAFEAVADDDERAREYAAEMRSDR